MAHKFKVGDHVVYTNDFGLCFGVKKIIELAEGFTDKDGPRYHYENSDTPWYPVAERNLQPADSHDLIVAKGNDDMVALYFQSKYGRDTTDEERASLLDNDPFEGE